MTRTLLDSSKMILGIGALACSTVAEAHGGHGGVTGFTAGLVHPITGLDHVAVMLAVGVLAGQQKARAAWALPVAFVLSMTASAALTATGAIWGWAEYGVLASMLVAGTALAFRIRGPLLVTVGMVVVFAAFHGHLHGAEAVAGARAGFLAGLFLATLGLHGLGFVLGRSATLDGLCRHGGVAIVAMALVGTI